MYILGDNNKLLPARKCKFSELNLTERRHLQEWIADNPDSLGEELLIIQKEFAGFAETNERLDLLALDKDGRLVVIENKRDNTGKDVTWQSIKYASYCSTLSKTQLISIFADYLVRNHGIADVNSLQEAEDRIKEFLGIESSDEDGGNVWDINVGANTQRIILVAVNFQIEVTSSVQWLSKYGLDIKCIKVTPYKFENCIIVDFDQIFPQNEMKDYTVKLAEKEKEASVIVSETANRRLGFWQRFIKYNKENNGPYFNNSATRDGGLVKGLGISGISCDVIVTTKSCRSQISINLGNASKNLEIFDYLYGKKEQIQSLMTSEFPLQWDRSEDKVISRIYTEFTKSYMQESEWPEI
ncbi:MAG: DUF4268 domain-containing protein, partial [Bacteroides sp.]|nr:DUF4268 domain-containing protein [Bacteroides sp.]